MWEIAKLSQYCTIQFFTNISNYPPLNFKKHITVQTDSTKRQKSLKIVYGSLIKKNVLVTTFTALSICANVQFPDPHNFNIFRLFRTQVVFWILNSSLSDSKWEWVRQPTLQTQVCFIMLCSAHTMLWSHISTVPS